MELFEMSPRSRRKLDDILRIGRKAAYNAQCESRRLGVPNVYSINGHIYYELPNGQLSLEDPYVDSDDASGEK